MSMNSFYLVSLALLFITVLSCNKDEEPEIEEEKPDATTLLYTLIQLGGGDTIMLSYRDLDGVGGNEPVIEGGTLAADAVYFGMMEVLNEAVSPVSSITEKVEAEQRSFQFFFTPQRVDLSFDYADQDNDGNPVGLNTAVRVGAPASGNLVIRLIYELNKNAEGIREGNLANVDGKTVLQANFPIDIQ